MKPIKSGRKAATAAMFSGLRMPQTMSVVTAQDPGNDVPLLAYDARALRSFRSTTPVVAGFAARLLEEADRMKDGDASKAELIRACLMAGAVKPAQWKQEEGKPLDNHLGAGRVHFDKEGGDLFALLSANSLWRRDGHHHNDVRLRAVCAPQLFTIDDIVRTVFRWRCRSCHGARVGACAGFGERKG